MSSTLRFLSAAALFISTCSASFIAPASNSTWNINSVQEVKWETAGLQAPLQMHLCPGGSKNIDNSMLEIAPSMGNTGSWMWQPTHSIPQHQTFVIIIIDNSGKYKWSDNFYMIGWQNQPPMHTPPPPMHEAPPPMHTLPPPPPPPMYEAPPPMHTPPPVLVHTSIILQSPSIHVSEIIVTSEVAPIVMTSEVAPIIETMPVAPIIMTQIQEPVTQIVPQAPILTTEYLAPIVKTVLVTETPAPIIRNMTQAPLTVIETKAPILITESQAPIIKTIMQPPHLITEQAPPVVITQHLTETYQPAPIETIITESMMAPVYTNDMPPPAHSTAVAIHTPGGYMPPPPAHTSMMAPPVVTPPSEIYTAPPPPAHSAGALTSAIYANTSVAYTAPAASVSVPAFELSSDLSSPPKATAPTDILIDTSATPVVASSTTFQTEVTTTSPLALAASQFSASFAMGTAAPSGVGVGGLQGQFTGAGSKVVIFTGGLMWIGFGAVFAAFMM